MYHLVVFASGNGSTLQAIIDSIHNHKLEAQIDLVVSDNPNSYALTRAKTNHIETYIIQNKNFESRDLELSQILSGYSIDLIVLARLFENDWSKLTRKIYNYQYASFFAS